MSSKERCYQRLVIVFDYEITKTAFDDFRLLYRQLMSREEYREIELDLSSVVKIKAADTGLLHLYANQANSIKKPFCIILPKDKKARRVLDEKNISNIMPTREACCDRTLMVMVE